MLDDYSKSQIVAYTLFKNQIINHQLSHAYLIDDNNSGVSYNIVLAFIKSILISDNDDKNDNISNLIDNGNYPELQIVKPDGMFIKKGQLIQLQDDFSKSSVYGKRKIYIIEDSDKMRPEAANAILKFLEEPSSDIIAFLLTNNFNNMLSTIVSRCQIVRLNNDLISDSSFDDICYSFVKSIENNKYNAFLSENKLFFDVIDYKNRENVVLFVDKLINLYYYVLKIVIGEEKKDAKFDDIANNNNLDSILNKINFLIEIKDSIKFNVNINLLIDSIVFNLGGNCEYSWN